MSVATSPDGGTTVALYDRLGWRLVYRRLTVTTLRAESLVNDGTALVLFSLAVGITTGDDHLGSWHVTGLLALSYGGGAVAGVIVAWFAGQLRRRLDDACRPSSRFTSAYTGCPPAEPPVADALFERRDLAVGGSRSWPWAY